MMPLFAGMIFKVNREQQGIQEKSVYFCFYAPVNGIIGTDQAPGK